MTLSVCVKLKVVSGAAHPFFKIVVNIIESLPAFCDKCFIIFGKLSKLPLNQSALDSGDAKSGS